ncbi:MAG: NADH-quinone oxidoreductase subunit NuoE [Armatimonadetes bacterium]|nr:NADH-quinone oxidoreductase subunit NuoE [Armatimonadota bacterium]
MADTTSDAAIPTAVSHEEICELLDRLAVTPESNLIATLQDIQDHFGYLPAPALVELSRRIRIPLSRIYGVVTFYAQFYTHPRGRHTIRVCCGTACHVKGGGQVLEAIQRELGITNGESTTDLKFYLETVACLGTCFLAPVIMIDDQYYGNLTPTSVGTILRRFGAESE